MGNSSTTQTQTPVPTTQVRRNIAAPQTQISKPPAARPSQSSISAPAASPSTAQVGIGEHNDKIAAIEAIRTALQNLENDLMRTVNDWRQKTQSCTVSLS